MKVLTHRAFFIVTYIVLMVPTYVLPYLGSNSSVLQGAASLDASDGGTTVQAVFLLHVGCLFLLALLAWFRGRSEETAWIVIFPVLAGVFDLVPGFSLIPLIPTFFHVLALIFGARGTATVKVVSEAGN